LTLFGDDYPTSDGTPIRDFVHVLDIAEAHIRALEATARQDGPGFLACNLGSGSGFSVREVLAAAERVVGRPIPVNVGPRRPGDPPILVAAVDRARDALGWTARHGTLEAMIESAWAWRLGHPRGYED
jgi:UDP-glucose 4-epimerase